MTPKLVSTCPFDVRRTSAKSWLTWPASTILSSAVSRTARAAPIVDPISAVTLPVPAAPNVASSVPFAQVARDREVAFAARGDDAGLAADHLQRQRVDRIARAERGQAGDDLAVPSAPKPVSRLPSVL